MNRTGTGYAPRLEVEDDRTVLVVPHSAGCLAVELSVQAVDDLHGVLALMADGSEGGTVVLDPDTWLAVSSSEGHAYVQLASRWACEMVDLDATQLAVLALEVAKARTLLAGAA